MLARGGIRDPRGFVGAIVNRHARGVYLRVDQIEDLEAHLLLELSRIAVRYDSARSTSLSKFLWQQLPLRVADWYRRERGDDRYNPRRPDAASLDSVELELVDGRTADAFSDAELRAELAALNALAAACRLL